ncbi:MAG TPA: alpha-E domain-containing protein [Myxococcota bacterium]|nr:alpha-E domain-containing protein [Myxococcota bacterium]
MLARHAEDLFWAGRYLERAEDTTRMLDVTYHGLLEGGSSDVEAAWRNLLEALQLAHPFYAKHEQVSPRAVAEFLVADVAQSSSIIAAIARARENGRNVREHLSTELWETLNSCFLELRARDLVAELAAQPHELYREIRTRCQAIAGAASETMARSDPWRFLSLGRLVERAEMTCRMLRVRASRRDARTNFHDFLLVLNSVSALEAYTRAHGAEIDPARVIAFLLLAPDFPRSVLYCVRGADELLAELEGGVPTVRPRRTLGRIRAELEYQDADELRAFGDRTVLDRAQSGIWEVAELVEESFFASGPTPQRHIFGSP